MNNEKLTQHILLAILREISLTNQILLDANAENLCGITELQQLLAKTEEEQKLVMELL